MTVIIPVAICGQSAGGAGSLGCLSTAPLLHGVVVVGGGRGGAMAPAGEGAGAMPPPATGLAADPAVLPLPAAIPAWPELGVLPAVPGLAAGPVAGVGNTTRRAMLPVASASAHAPTVIASSSAALAKVRAESCIMPHTVVGDLFIVIFDFIFQCND